VILPYGCYPRQSVGASLIRCGHDGSFRQTRYHGRRQMCVIREEAYQGTLIVSGCNSSAHRFRRLAPDNHPGQARGARKALHA